ncbi:hypothetical protein ACLOJK_035724 [Asimina triloba]
MLQSSLLNFQPSLPDQSHPLSLIQSCKNAQQIHALSIKIGAAHDPPIASRLLSLYSDPKTGNFEHALSVFEQMRNPNSHSWNTIIKYCVETHHSHDALVLFRKLLWKSAVPPDNFTLPCVIKGCARLGAAEEGEQIHGLALKIGLGLDVYVQGSLLNFYSKCGETESARKVFDGMPTKDLVCWNSLMDGYVKSGEIARAREVFDEMPERDLFSWTVLVNGYSKCGEVETARKFFNQMPEKNVVSWNAMIDGYMRSGDCESARQLFNEMLDRNAVTWNSMISGYENNGRFVEALEMFQSMMDAGVKPNAATLVGALSAVSGLGLLEKGSHAGLVDEGRQYFEFMSSEYAITPTIEHYGCLVDLLCRAGHVEEAKDLIEKIPMKSNEVIWMSLLSGCRNHGNVEIGEYAAKRVAELAPDATGSYILLSSIYAKACRWSDVSALREMMKERGVRKVPGCSLIEHGGSVHKFVVADRSHPQTEYIYSKLNEMETRLRCTGYIPDTTQVSLCLEETEKAGELAHHSERLAIAFGLISTEPGNPIRIVKNLRVCNDCHVVTKLLSSIYEREIIVRDNSRFHHFRNGSCSCNDYW